MQIRQLKVRNFRGIGVLDWKPGQPFCCLIGSGDTGKSTILDAMEAALSSRWFSFAESDFFRCSTDNPISIEATVGELSRALKSDAKFGLYIRGWTAASELIDEPEDGDEPVLTVRLIVDASLEPVWEIICDRIPDPRTLSNRDRALFGLVRLAGDDARHLSWGQGSVLSRLTDDNDEAAASLAKAYRAARESAKLNEIEALAKVASAAEEYAKGLGAYVEGGYEPGLELGRAGLSAGAITLHDNGVPLRLAGLGSKRLATLAIQKSAVADGAIILVDELELGLEPHRIIGAIAQLKGDQATAVATKKPVGQVMMTTHSDIAIAEAGSSSLHVLQVSRPDRTVSVRKAKSPEAINPLLRFTPRALFARRILVCEGHCEMGLLLGLRERWPSRHDNIPIEQLGAAIADGNGEQAASMALSLAELGFTTAIFRDSDKLLDGTQLSALQAAGVPILEYGDALRTEQALFGAASDQDVQKLLQHARAERGDGAVDDNLKIALPKLDIGTLRSDFAIWDLVEEVDPVAVREAIAEVAHRKKWFKDQRIARGLAPAAWSICEQNPGSKLADALRRVEQWLYA